MGDEVMKQIFMWSAFGLLILAGGTGIFRNPVAFLGVIPAVLLIIGANMDRINSFEVSGSSVKADLKEITAQVADAKSILRGIQDLAVANAKLMLYSRLSSNAIVDSSADPAVLDDIFKKKVLSMLRAMGVPDVKIQEVEKSDRDFVLSAYSYFVFRYALAQLPSDQQEKLQMDYNLIKNKSVDGPVNIEDMNVLFTSYKIDTRRFAEYLEDYKYYQNNTTQRRPEIWAKRSTWGYPDDNPSKQQN